MVLFNASRKHFPFQYLKDRFIIINYIPDLSTHYFTQVSNFRKSKSKSKHMCSKEVMISQVKNNVMKRYNIDPLILKSYCYELLLIKVIVPLI
jgi:hypothetical protein